MVLTFLGIEIDMVANWLRLPQEKLHDICMTTYLQMDAIRGKTGSYLIAKKKRVAIPNWPPQSRNHCGASRMRLLVKHYRFLHNNHTPGAMSSPQPTGQGGHHLVNIGMVLP